MLYSGCSSVLTHPHRVVHPEAAACGGLSEKDREALLAFFDFPTEHWLHLRTTIPVESAFATAHLPQRVTKGAG